MAQHRAKGIDSSYTRKCGNSPVVGLRFGLSARSWFHPPTGINLPMGLPALLPAPYALRLSSTKPQCWLRQADSNFSGVWVLEAIHEPFSWHFVTPLGPCRGHVLAKPGSRIMPLIYYVLIFSTQILILVLGWTNSLAGGPHHLFDTVLRAKHCTSILHNEYIKHETWMNEWFIMLIRTIVAHETYAMHLFRPSQKHVET